MEGRDKKVDECKPGREFSLGTKPTSTLIWMFQSPELGEATVCFSSPPFCRVLLWQSELTKAIKVPGFSNQDHKPGTAEKLWLDVSSSSKIQPNIYVSTLTLAFSVHLL